jgi:hypothetical protein
MQFDLTPALRDRAGRPIVDGDRPATLASAIVQALDTVPADDTKLSGPEKMRRYRLASRILSAPALVTLTLEEAALCKQLVGDGYGPLIVGQVWAVLEPDAA